jgi:hypothetical protein
LSLLDLAIKHKNIEFMRSLIECGADVDDYMLALALEVELDAICQANSNQEAQDKAMANVKLDGAFVLLISGGANPASIASQLRRLCTQFDPSGAVMMRLQSILDVDETD